MDKENKVLDLTYEVIVLDPTYGKQPRNKSAVVNEVTCLIYELNIFIK